MFERLADLEAELEELEGRLPDVYASGDQAAQRAAGRRHAELRPIVDAYRQLRRARADMEDARELLRSEADPAMREFLKEEMADKELALADLEGRLRALLLPRDPNDDKNVIVESRGAEGGEEANLFAGDLVRMYQRYADRRGWKFEMLSGQPSDMGGFKEATFLVKGDRVWSRLKHEAGPHRVQRVPVTESQGRVHTSAAGVLVMPEAEQVDVQVEEKDLRIDVFRSSGPGGQSVNTTDSAVRITHKPTGVQVAMQDEKSQHQNRDKAMRVLRARLFERAMEEQRAEQAADRKAQVGTGERSEKIRTYNFPQDRVTDHRVGLTKGNLPGILGGELDLHAVLDAERFDPARAKTL